MQYENKPNKLIKEKSPYLLQHAYNPVNWYPWGEEAFKIAKDENKPVFLSIGYSTCHWCHVMEKESFEDNGIAEEMNKAFISIKVDREERPDIDSVYMSVCQMMTGGGGWPLTIIMTPDKKPFFAGTYFPKESRFNRIGMYELIRSISEAWEVQQDQIKSTTDQIEKNLLAMNNEPAEEMPGRVTLNYAFESLFKRYDENKGGFTTAPKFPSPHNLMFLMRYWKRTGENIALEMVEKTLLEMSKGGIKDHVGFGFHRYSTDNNWIVPHFEKMLYDQGMLMLAYTEGFQTTRNEIFKDTVYEIAEYVLRDMTSEQGGFYSAEDADSEGIEGKFYLWEESELKKILDSEDFGMIKELYNTRPEGNFDEESTGRKTGNNIFHMGQTISDNAQAMGISYELLKEKLEPVRKKLFEHRDKRIRPGKDDKILTDWNGLMIAALAKAGRVFNEKRFIEAAERAFAFIMKELTSYGGRLIHRYRDGEAALDSTIDDYAYLIWGLIELYETTFNTDYYEKAIELYDLAENHYWDSRIGGFYLSADDSELVLVRTKDAYDGAIPSGNSVMLSNMLKLGNITSDSKYHKHAEKLCMAFSKNINRVPITYCFMLCGLEMIFFDNIEIVIVKEESDPDTDKIISYIQSVFFPTKVVIEKNEKTVRFAPYIQGMESRNGKTTVYICKNYTCDLPVNTLEEVKAKLKI